MKLTPNRLDIASMSVVYTNSNGILSMQRGPDGSLYFSDYDYGAHLGSIYKLVNA